MDQINFLSEQELNEFTPLQIVVRNGNFDEALRKFKMAVQKDGILNVLRERQRYEKPSVKKRREKRESIQRIMITALREKQMLSGEWDARQKKKEQKKLQKIQFKKENINDC